MRCEPIIRRADSADRDAVAALEHDCFGDEAWSSDLLSETRLVLVAEASGVLVGFVVLIVSGHPDDPLDLARIAVSRAHRRTGIGAQLLEAALPRDRTVLLEVAEGNEVARRLYDRFGFVEISRRRRYYPGGEDAVIMRRKRD